MIGQIAGSYRIVSKLSEGGMGVVYRAEHQMIGRVVAVKVLLPELSHHREIVTRFFNEARAATAVRHPGIVEIFDFGYMPSGQAYLVMELLQGESIARRLRRVGRMSEAEAASIIRSTSIALGAAHAHGIVHRDLKPDNLFLCPDPGVPGGERPKLLDFGIAKLTGPSSPQGASLTQTGAVLGTPTYMSPEQCRGAGEVDQRADLYSLGCILFELITGRPPFTSQAPGELIANHLMEQPVSPRTLVPEVTPACEAIIMRLLAKRPEERFGTAEELAAALEPLSPMMPQPSWAGLPVPGAFEQVPTTVTTPPPVWPQPSRHSLSAMPGVPTPPPPTTLGASAAEASMTAAGVGPGSKRGLAIGLGALFGVAAIVVAVLVLSGGGGKKVATEPGAYAPPTDPVVKPPPPPPPTDPVVTPPTDPRTTATDPVVTPPIDPKTTATDPVVTPPTDPKTTATDPKTTATDPKTTKPIRPIKPKTPIKPKGPIDTGVMEPTF